MSWGVTPEQSWPRGLPWELPHPTAPEGRPLAVPKPAALMIQQYRAHPKTLSPATLGNEEGKFTKTHPKPSNKPNLPSNRSGKKASHSPRRTQPFGPEDAGVPHPTQYKARLDPQNHRCRQVGTCHRHRSRRAAATPDPREGLQGETGTSQSIFLAKATFILKTNVRIFLVGTFGALAFPGGRKNTAGMLLAPGLGRRQPWRRGAAASTAREEGTHMQFPGSSGYPGGLLQNLMFCNSHVLPGRKEVVFVTFAITKTKAQEHFCCFCHATLQKTQTTR